MIELNRQMVPYTLKISKRTRSLRISIHPGGEVVIVSPSFLSFNHVERFIVQKADWILQKVEHLKHLPKKPSAAATRKEYLLHKQVALQLVKERIRFFNAHYQFKFARISVRNQTTRWGSCSKKGNLNFNYKLALLPIYLADYVVVHELCHLKELNHSKNFWKLVAETIPNHRLLRLELRKQGRSLFL